MLKTKLLKKVEIITVIILNDCLKFVFLGMFSFQNRPFIIDYDIDLHTTNHKIPIGTKITSANWNNYLTCDQH